MIKKILLISIVSVAFLLAAVSYFSNTDIQETTNEGSVATTKNSENKQMTTYVGDSEYVVSWVEIDDFDKLTIHSNLSEMLSSKEAMSKFNCQTITNAGFYSTEDTHLGLLIEDGETISDSGDSQLLNGYFSYDDLATITSNPVENPRYAVQSGPLLMLDKEIVESKVANNEEARRVMVATTEKDTVLLVVIYDPSSRFKGPKLSEVSNVLHSFEQTTNTTIRSALNLDGGSASLFVSGDVALREVAKAGGFICVKK